MDNTKTTEVTTQREPARGLDHVMVALFIAGLVVFWCLVAIWWIES